MPRLLLANCLPRHGSGCPKLSQRSIDSMEERQAGQSLAAPRLPNIVGTRPSCPAVGRQQPSHAPRQDRVTTFERSEEHTSELQSLMRISNAVFCLKTKQT